MKHYIVYHDPETMGYDADEIDGFSIVTSKRVGDIAGSKIWVVTGRGKPRRYSLAKSFIAEATHPDPRDPELTLVSAKSGTRYPRDTFLNGRPWFPAFKRTMGNFGFGLQRINSAATIEGLESIQATPVAAAPPAISRRTAGIRESLPESSSSTYYDPTRGIDRAMSIRQPFAEQVLRGDRMTEYRSRPTTIRERVWIYATPSPAGSEDVWEESGFVPGELPVGVVVGSVEITDCRWDERSSGFAYKLERPLRLPEPKEPVNQPLPLFWKPEFADS